MPHPCRICAYLWLLARFSRWYAAGSGCLHYLDDDSPDLASGAGLNQGYSSAASAIGWAGGVIIGAVLGGILVGASGIWGCVLFMTALLVVIAAVTTEVRTGSRLGTTEPARL